MIFIGLFSSFYSLFFICLCSLAFIYKILDLIRKNILLKRQTYINKESTVLITGGSIGIGFELIKILFSNTKCRVINVDIRESSFNELSELAKANNTYIDNYCCDLSNIEDMNQTFNKILSKYNRIDFLINNAGISFNKEFEDSKEEEIIKTINVNQLSPALICKKVIPLMVKNNLGHVVTVASVLSHLTPSIAPDYTMTKWGIYGYHESLRYNYLVKGNKNINFTIICPYTINTGMFKGFNSPIKFIKILEPDYVARRIFKAIVLKENVVFIQGIHKYIMMLAKILPEWIYNIFHLYIVERKKQNLVSREDNYKLLNMKE